MDAWKIISLVSIFENIFHLLHPRPSAGCEAKLVRSVGETPE